MDCFRVSLLLLDLLGMIDGSFPCHRGKYAKRLFSAQIKPHMLLCVFLVQRAYKETFTVEFRAFIDFSVKREAKIRLLASLANQLLFKN